jgi:hypothetical protein
VAKPKLVEGGRKVKLCAKTFTEAMEAAEVPESTTKLIIGHKRPSLTYGHYSKGERVKLRDYINKLHYSRDVMRLIRGVGRPVAPQERKRGRRPKNILHAATWRS